MAFCQYCGKEIPEDARFCPHCGATLTSAQNDFQPNMNMNQAYYQVQLPMNWYKFLIYVALFLGAIGNAFSGFQQLTGGHYGDMASMVYAYYPALKTIDIVVGIATIALAVFAIIVRQKLANFRSDAPKMLLMLYVASIALSVIYLILVIGVIGSDVIEISTLIPSLSVSVVMAIVNKIYFDKRQHLFIN